MKRRGATAALLGMLLSGCAAMTASGAGSPSREAGPSIGIATLELPVVSGSRGQIAGYFPEPAGPAAESSDQRDPRFTYVIDFRVVEVSANDRRPMKAEGVRRIYFHPDGARIAFADLSRFVAGEPIATDRVTFTFDFTPDWRQVVLRMLLRRTSTRTIDYDGRAVTPPDGPETSFALFGRFSPVYRGYLLTDAGV